MNCVDTIVAPCTGIGGAITVIRIAGPEALSVGNRVWQSSRPLSKECAREMRLGKLGGAHTLAVYMPSPNSYTGDDVVELHCHGGAATADFALREILSLQCRLAEPGEFTFRAFVNGKMDLVQAEAVAELIHSASEGARMVSERQLAGELSARLRNLKEQVNLLRSECEARLDFPDEDLDFDNTIAEKAATIGDEIQLLLSTKNWGAALRDGVSVVLAGRPNSGKSSLLNGLLGFDRAIVSPAPGTTRDTIEENIVLRNIPVRLIDTAGLRESGDLIEAEGVARSRRSIAAAQVCFWLLDSTGDDLKNALLELTESGNPNIIAVFNKCDLVPEMKLPEISVPAVKISAKTGYNFELLLDKFVEVVLSGKGERLPDVAVNARCAQLLERASESLEEARLKFMDSEFELAAVELAVVSRKLGLIIGEECDPDILDAVFHRFCIGK